MDTPLNVVLSNRREHWVKLGIDTFTDHSTCCHLRTPGALKIIQHPSAWATIQSIRRNRVPLCKHIIFILEQYTSLQNLYSIALMASEKITLVTSNYDLETALRRSFYFPYKQIQSEFLL